MSQSWEKCITKKETKKLAWIHRSHLGTKKSSSISLEFIAHWHSKKHNGKYFGQNFLNLPLVENLISSVFLHGNLVFLHVNHDHAKYPKNLMSQFWAIYKVYFFQLPRPLLIHFTLFGGNGHYSRKLTASS